MLNLERPSRWRSAFSRRKQGHAKQRTRQGEPSDAGGRGERQMKMLGGARVFVSAAKPVGQAKSDNPTVERCDEGRARHNAQATPRPYRTGAPRRDAEQHGNKRQVHQGDAHAKCHRGVLGRRCGRVRLMERRRIGVQEPPLPSGDQQHCGGPDERSGSKRQIAILGRASHDHVQAQSTRRS